MMNEYAPAIRATESPQRTQFTMVPNILIDGYDELSDAARFAFIKFMRLVRKVGYFAGSITKLGKKLKIARMTINRMVREWAKFLLIKIEPIEDTDAVRVIPLTDLLWQANTDHYQYAPAEVREPVTICDTISTTDTSETDRVVTNCDTSSQNVTEPVTICDEASQPQAQNDPQYLYKNIGNNKRKNISLTDVSDDAPRSPYKDGYQRQDLVAMTSLLGDLFEETNARFPDIPPSLPLTPAQEAKLYTMPVEMVCISDNDNHYHSHIVQATRNEGEDNGTDTQHSRDNSAGRPRIDPLLPISGGSGLHHDSHPEGYQESAQRRGRVESATRKKASKPKPEPVAPPAIQLTEQQQAFWLLWCDIWFNQDIPPELNETAYKHVKKLAPLVKTKEQLEDLVKHARVEMEASGFKRKVVHLGNLVNSYPGWKQQSRPIAPGVAVPQNFTGMGKLLHIKPQEANRGQTFTS